MIPGQIWEASLAGVEVAEHILCYSVHVKALHGSGVP
jgi:hypothetical protein